LGRAYPRAFKFNLSVSLYKCCNILFFETAILSEGKDEKPGNYQIKQCYFLYHGLLHKKILGVFLTPGFAMPWLRRMVFGISVGHPNISVVFVRVTQPTTASVV
jgi:hypothetical protein